MSRTKIGKHFLEALPTVLREKDENVNSRNSSCSFIIMAAIIKCERRDPT